MLHKWFYYVILVYDNINEDNNRKNYDGNEQ